MSRVASPQMPACRILILLSVSLISSAAAGQIAFSTSTLNFGNVQAGSSLIMPVAVTNTSKETMTISTATVSGIGFKVAGPSLPISISPRRTASVSVSFSPLTAGAVTGSLTLTGSSSWGGRHSRYRSSSISLALSGSGYTSGVGYLSAPSSLNLGSVSIGSSQTQALTVSNSGSSSLTISAANVSGTGYSVSGLALPYTLAAGSSASLAVTFSPATAGTNNATLSLSSNASDPSVLVALAGNGTSLSGTLAVTPGSVSFGSATVGSTQTQTLTLSNSGAASLTISSASVSGAGFSVSGLPLPYALAAGTSANLAVTFSPAATGTNNATLSLSSNASNPSVSVALAGSGTSSSGTLAVTPGSISFGTVTIGSPQTQNGSITASGGSVTVSSASSSNSAFTLGGLALPVTIASGQSVPFSITFAPTTTGAASGNISFFSNSSSSSESVSGSGATIQHTVSLSWLASTSTSVSGYNVYRGTATGGPYAKLNPILDAAMNYSDGVVQSGRTYYYVTTAVDSSGVESSYSSEVQAVIPFP